MKDAPAVDTNVARALSRRFGFGTADATADFLETVGYRVTEAEHDRQRDESDGDLGHVVDVLEDPQALADSPVSILSTICCFRRQ